MAKFKNNEKLTAALQKAASKEAVKTANSIPEYNAVNRQGYAAYLIDDELRFVSMLNTLKLEPQFYRSDTEQMREIQELLEKLALNDPYFVAQCIVWSRCLGEGMRSINHVAAACLAPFISGQEWSKRFYGPFNKKTKSGGCIYRPDDMSEIKEVFSSISPKTVLTNSMKKGFAKVIESLDTYQLIKYKKSIIDIANLCHPDSSKTPKYNDITILDAIMRGEKVSANTWEVAQSEAGQIVAKAVREGKISKEKAEEVLKEQKNENWKELLNNNELGILAALRNLRNILSGEDENAVDSVCKLVSNGELLKKGKIMPYQIDLAYESIIQNTSYLGRKVRQALEEGIEKSIPNLKEILPGRNLVIVDCSGSMSTSIAGGHSSCSKKAALIAAMILKATNGDLIRFGSNAEYTGWNIADSVFALANKIENDDMGWTNLASAFNLASQNKYDRIFILSDNECNTGNQKNAYKEYIRKSGLNPYIYSIDMASYGTKPIDSDHVHYFFGYGYAMFDSITKFEFNAINALDEIRKVVI